MKEKLHLLPQALTALGIALLATSASARTWTSSDGGKTFDGDFISSKNGEVTVMHDAGKKMSFKLEMLSDTDQKWIEKELTRRAESASLATAAIPTTLEGNLQKLSGKSFKKFEPAAPSKYYLLYFSASW